MSASETRMRELIKKIPDGVYSFEDQLDDYGPGTEPIRVAVDITVEESTIEVDFSRSSDQVPAALNSYINYTRAYTTFAVKVFCDALLPQNEGGIRPIKTTAREGSFFNPTFPAASGGRATVQIRIFDAINGALSQALPHRAMGAFSHWNNPNIGGTDPRTGKSFVMYDLGFGGYGGRADSDGPEALAPVVNCRNIPIEVHEHNNPVRIKKLELITDSGGAGQYRGGCGLRKDIELLADQATITLLGDRHKFAPYGLFGGHAGANAQTILNPDGAAEALGSKSVHQLKRGDVVSFRLAGAGGYGNPADRDPAAVKRDLADGFISPDHAMQNYGVDLDLITDRRAVIPPSIVITHPEMNPARSDARKTIKSPTSSAVPPRPPGNRASNSCQRPSSPNMLFARCFSIFSIRPVSIGPGLTATTRTP